MRGNHIDEVAKSEGLFINQTKSFKRKTLQFIQRLLAPYEVKNS